MSCDRRCMGDYGEKQMSCETCPGRAAGPAERVSVAQVIGVLEIVKTEVMGAQ